MSAINISYAQTLIEQSKAYIVPLLENPTVAPYFATALKVASCCAAIIPMIYMIASYYGYTFFQDAGDSTSTEKNEFTTMPHTLNKDLNVHLSAIKHAQELYKNNQERVERASLLDPIENYVVEPLTTRCSDWMHRGCKWTWHRTLGKYVSSDPISTEKFLSMGEKVEKNSHTVAMQEPTKLPLIGALHKSAIVAARYLFILSRDMNTVLRLPQNVRKKTETIFTVAKEEIVDKMSQDYLESKDETDQEDATLVDMGKDILKKTVVKVGAGAAKNKLDTLKDKLTSDVSKKERELREKVVALAADQASYTAIAYGVGGAIRTGIVFGAFYALENIPFEAIGLEGSLFTQSLPYITSNVAKISTVYLWYRCLQPTVKRLEDEHELEFNPEETLFSQIPGVENLTNFIPTAIDKIANTFVLNKYLDNFQARLQEEL